MDFTEVLTLPATLPAPDPCDPGVQALLRACLLSFGVSYYKAALPERVVAPPLSAAEAPFWDLLYTEGLGELHFRNGLPIRASAGFGASVDATLPAAPADGGWPDDSAAPRPALVLVGGGKDSALVAEIVRASKVPAAALSVGHSGWMRRSAEAAGLAWHTVERRIDPALFRLNAAGAWNGHVPISACIAAISTLVAHAAGFGDVLVGNERGADDANLIWQGRPVNHQWSKSTHFERAFQRWCRQHVPGTPRYASLLRPLGEIRIAERFARCTGQHDRFTSCNRNFRLDPAEHPERWCGRCAKCVFVALLLAPWLEPDAYRGVFGQDILGDAANRPHLLALLGLSDVKPWDCVGTARECWLSLLMLAQRGTLPAALADLPGLAPAGWHGDDWQGALAEELASSPAATLPAAWRQRLDAYLAAD